MVGRSMLSNYCDITHNDLEELVLELLKPSIKIDYRNSSVYCEFRTNLLVCPFEFICTIIRNPNFRSLIPSKKSKSSTLVGSK